MATFAFSASLGAGVAVLLQLFYMRFLGAISDQNLPIDDSMGVPMLMEGERRPEDNGLLHFNFGEIFNDDDDTNHNTDDDEEQDPTTGEGDNVTPRVEVVNPVLLNNQEETNSSRRRRRGPRRDLAGKLDQTELSSYDLRRDGSRSRSRSPHTRPATSSTLC